MRRAVIFVAYLFNRNCRNCMVNRTYSYDNFSQVFILSLIFDKTDLGGILSDLLEITGPWNNELELWHFYLMPCSICPKITLCHVHNVMIWFGFSICRIVNHGDGMIQVNYVGIGPREFCLVRNWVVEDEYCPVLVRSYHIACFMVIQGELALFLFKNRLKVPFDPKKIKNTKTFKDHISSLIRVESWNQVLRVVW